jgi:hypothetical protein
MTLSPNDLPCVEDYFCTFQTLILLLKNSKIDLKDDRCIYVILSNIDSEYYVFVSTFDATRESLRGAYQTPTIESFCDSLIREKDKFLQLGMISTTGTLTKP